MYIMHCVGASVHVVLFNPHHSVFSMNLKKKKTHWINKNVQSAVSDKFVFVCHIQQSTLFFLM